MSDPNPFSNSNAPQHNLVSKIVSSPLLGAPYQVAVDLVDVHTAYALQIGSPDAPVIQEFVQNIGTSEYRVENIYANNIYGTINGNNVLGGTGITVTPSDAGSIISADFTAGTGISFNIQDNQITVQNTLNFTAGFGISISDVSLPDEDLPFGTRVISFIGTGPTGPTGNPQVAGNPGEIPFIGQTGGYLDVDPSLSYAITAPDPTLNVPTTYVKSVNNDGIIKLSTDIAGDSVIETGFEDYAGMGNVLSIQSVGATAATVTIDTIDSFVGINKTPTVELDVVGQTVLSYSIGTGATTTSYQAITGGTGISGTLMLSPGIYHLYAWGQGGAANGGAGGAGGYGEYEFTVAGTTTFGWTGGYGGASGGGNALVITLGGVEKIIVPGGGAGVTGGTGGGGGNSNIGGLPTPEGGFLGGTTASYAEYTDTRYWTYTTTGGIVIGSATNNDAYTNGLTGYITQGMTMIFSQSLSLYSQSISGITYIISPGTTISIETAGTSFTNADLIIPGGAKLPLSNISGLTVDGLGVTGVTGTGGASYDNWVNSGNSGGVSFTNTLVDTGEAGLTYSNGTVVMSGGPYEFVTGDTFTFFFQGSITVFQNNQVLVIGAGTTMIASEPLGTTHMIGLTFTSTGNAVLPVGSEINVAQRYFKNTQPVETGKTGGAYGGGGLEGGGAPSLVVDVSGMTLGTVGNRLAGGGGGSYSNTAGITMINQTPGEGPLAFKNNLNRAGYGMGATGSGTPGSQYLVLEQKITGGNLGPALTVNGSAIVSSDLTILGSTAASAALTVGQNTAGQTRNAIVTGRSFLSGGIETAAASAFGSSSSTIQCGLQVFGNITVAASAAGGGTIGCTTLNASGGVYGIDNTTRVNLPTGFLAPNGTFGGTGANCELLIGNATFPGGSIVGYNDVSATIPPNFPKGLKIPGVAYPLTIMPGSASPYSGSFEYGSTTDLSGYSIKFGPPGASNIEFNDGGSAGYSLTVKGLGGSTFAKDCIGSDFIIRSDSRLKENIVTVDSALDKVMKMRGVYFNKLDETTRRIGVIAQEVEQVLPEVVHTDDTPEQMKAVSYANIVGLLIEAIKEQQEMIKLLRDQSTL